MTRATPALLATLASIGLACGCTSGGLPTGGNADLGGSQPGDLAGGPPADLAPGPGDGGPDCLALDECACYVEPRCAPVVQVCHCPFPQCGKGACFCDGGAYLGCIPASTPCGPPQCSAADRLVGPDVQGCFRCELASCQAGIDNMIRNCRLNPAVIGALSCDKNPGCIADCMRKLDSCFAIGCAFCTTCDCGGSTPFDRCVTACL